MELVVSTFPCGVGFLSLLSGLAVIGGTAELSPADSCSVTKVDPIIFPSVVDSKAGLGGVVLVLSVLSVILVFTFSGLSVTDFVGKLSGVLKISDIKVVFKSSSFGSNDSFERVIASIPQDLVVKVVVGVFGSIVDVIDSELLGLEDALVVVSRVISSAIVMASIPLGK